jgi:hypothetical protein
MKIRTITAKFRYCNSGTEGEETVTVVFEDRDDKYIICKPYVVEKGQKLVFDKETNEFLVND